MSRFDDVLRDALRREDPGEDFTRRVLAALPARQEPKPGWRERWSGWFRMPAVRWATVCATVILLMAGGAEIRERRERARGEAAKEQLMVAMRIAGTKLHTAQTKVFGISEQ